VENRDFVRVYVEEFINRRDAAAAERILAPDFVYHGPNGPATTGRESYVRRSHGFLEAFPDWRAEICDVLVDGDMVSDRVHISATHSGSINNVAPTGERIDDDCVHLWRVEGDRIVEGWLFCNANMLRVMRLASAGPG
jgi:predicted ester cyclase